MYRYCSYDQVPRIQNESSTNLEIWKYFYKMIDEWKLTLPLLEWPKADTLLFYSVYNARWFYSSKESLWVGKG